MNKTRFLFVLIPVLLFSCKSMKPFSHNNEAKEIKELKILYDKLDQNKLDYDYLSSKGRIEVNSPELNQSANLYLRLIKDSLIWGSVTYMFGIEVFRFYFSSAGLTLLDRFHKQYYSYNYSELQNMFAIPELDLTFIENLLSGNLAYKLDKFEVTFTDENIEFTGNDPVYSKSIWIENKQAVVKKYSLREKSGNRSASLVYRSWIGKGKHQIPGNVEILLFTPEKKSLILNISAVEINKPFSISTRIPDDYDKAN